MRCVIGALMQKDNTRMIFKVASEGTWAEACENGVFSGSADDVRDGFVHLSAAHQLAGTLAKHFAGQRGLILAAFDETALGAALKWESSRGGDLFPHLYGPLPTGLALWTKPLALGDDGIPRLPEGVI